MSQWLDVDLSDGTRFNLGDNENSTATIIVLLFISFFSGLFLYSLVVHLMWWPFSIILLGFISLLILKNVIKYIIPHSILKMLQKKTRIK